VAANVSKQKFWVVTLDQDLRSAASVEKAQLLGHERHVALVSDNPLQGYGSTVRVAVAVKVVVLLV
jgi:hypothetical protein